MNRKTIQKITDELDKDTPRLDYIRGVLETLMETLPEENHGQSPNFTVPSDAVKHSIAVQVDKILDEEGDILNRQTGAKLNNVDFSAIKHD